MQGIPRWLMVFGVVLIASIELAARLPDILLFSQRLHGAAGEYDAKALQADATTAQIAKAQAEAKQAVTQAQLNEVQQARVAAETKVQQLQADLTAANTVKTNAETRVQQLQADLTAANTAKAYAESRQAESQARQADSQALKNNLDNAGTIISTTAVIGGLAWLASKYGGGSEDTKQPTQQATTQQAKQTTTQQASSSEAFQLGRDDWLRYYNWGRALPDDQKAGANYWAAVRRKDKQTPQSCNNGPPPITASFLKACETAKGYFALVDKARLNNDDYANGWSGAFKETGGF